jgi:hypothetical protein
MRQRLLLAVLGLAACTPPQYAASVSTPIDPALGQQIAFDMARFVGARIRPGQGPIDIEPVVGDEAVGPNLADSLKAAGFRIVDRGGKHHIRYAASMIDGDVITRISVDTSDGARMYTNRPKAGLTPEGPFTVVERGTAND